MTIHTCTYNSWATKPTLQDGQSDSQHNDTPICILLQSLVTIGSDDPASGVELSESSASGVDPGDPGDTLSDMELCDEGEIVEG